LTLIKFRVEDQLVLKNQLNLLNRFNSECCLQFIQDIEWGQ